MKNTDGEGVKAMEDDVHSGMQVMGSFIDRWSIDLIDQSTVH